jgi:hypothetical protein
MINQGLVASCEDKIGSLGLPVVLEAAPHLTAV